MFEIGLIFLEAGVNGPSSAYSRNCWLLLNRTKPCLTGFIACNFVGRSDAQLASIGSPPVSLLADAL